MKSCLYLKLFISCLLFITAGNTNLFANTYTVTSTFDGTNSATTVGTLRWAITQANSNPGYDIINFNIDASGNTFETDGGSNSWAVIVLGSALPALGETVLIDGTTQPNTNLGFIPGKTVGATSFVQGNINYPDVYIVRSYTLPTSSAGLAGNGFTINAANITIKGLAISGFGNTGSDQATATGHADISIQYASTARTMNTVISDCFLSCDPRGIYPATSTRRTLGNAILILANNNYGTIQRNYISHTGSFGIVMHANQDNIDATNPNIAPSTNWTIEENQISNIGISTTISSGGRSADGISMMTAKFWVVRNNYIENWEQFAIDMGHNADDNRAENNTLTGFTRTNGSAPCGGIRVGFSSERDSVIQNKIFNLTTTSSLGGIWSDRSRTPNTSTLPGGVQKNSSSFYYALNTIHNNTGSGITLSTNGDGSLTGVTISQNNIYSNSGLGVDLNFSGTTGSTSITLNDDGDGDAGINNLQNFPLIDSAKFTSTQVTIWGKGPAGGTYEFFTTDGEANKFGLGLDYGEGRLFVGTGIEGSVNDGATGTGSYNIDGNVATNNVNMFRFTFNVFGLPASTLFTANATVAGSTSEFGPRAFVTTVLGCLLLDFLGVYEQHKVKLNWEALCDDQFKQFVIEESLNGIVYQPIDYITAFTINEKKNYTFERFKELNAPVYYRIKMINKDGSYQYSRVVRLGSLKTATTKVSPNPIVDHFNLQVRLDRAQAVQVVIYSNTGAFLESRSFSGTRGVNTFLIDGLHYLPKGSYIADITTTGQREKQVLIKN